VGEAVSAKRWRASPSSVDRVGDAGAGLAGERITTDAIGSESDTSGAISLAVTSGTADGAAPAGAAAAGGGIATAGSAKGDLIGRGPRCRVASIARWANLGNRLGPAEADRVMGSAEGIGAGGIAAGGITDAVGAESVTSGATELDSLSSVAASTRCAMDGPARYATAGTGVAVVSSSAVGGHTRPGPDR
jgi:hypothetical protein